MFEYFQQVIEQPAQKQDYSGQIEPEHENNDGTPRFT